MPQSICHLCPLYNFIAHSISWSLQVPAHFISTAQRVQVVASESAPRTFVAGQRKPLVPRGSSALAIQVPLHTCSR